MQRPLKIKLYMPPNSTCPQKNERHFSLTPIHLILQARVTGRLILTVESRKCRHAKKPSSLSKVTVRKCLIPVGTPSARPFSSCFFLLPPPLKQTAPHKAQPGTFRMPFNLLPPLLYFAACTTGDTGGVGGHKALEHTF